MQHSKLRPSFPKPTSDLVVGAAVGVALAGNAAVVVGIVAGVAAEEQPAAEVLLAAEVGLAAAHSSGKTQAPDRECFETAGG